MDRIKYYYEVEIGFNKKNYEAILTILYLAGVDNILERENSFVLYFKEEDDEKRSLVFRYLYANGCYNDSKYKVRKIIDEDWNKNWKKTIKPVLIRDKIVIYPSWLKKDIRKYKNRILIEIDPKMSFGTGHNETTQLVIDLMCDFMDLKDEYILDYGCGTGILAIAAINFGAKEAVAIDIDEDSIENAKEYVINNKVSDKIKIYKKDIFEIKETNFDIIFANILRDVIEKNLYFLSEKLKDGGKLFISGVLADEESQISKSLKANHFNIREIRYKSEWLGIYAVKKKKYGKYIHIK